MRDIEQIMRSYPIDFVQVTYSLADRRAEERIFPLARERGIAVIANRPFEQGELLRAALATLTPDERQAIETSFFAGLTHAEGAERLNQPLGTIKTRIRSGLHKLRQALTAEAVEP